MILLVSMSPSVCSQHVLSHAPTGTAGLTYALCKSKHYLRLQRRHYEIRCQPYWDCWDTTYAGIVVYLSIRDSQGLGALVVDFIIALVCCARYGDVFEWVILGFLLVEDGSEVVEQVTSG